MYPQNIQKNQMPVALLGDFAPSYPMPAAPRQVAKQTDNLYDQAWQALQHKQYAQAIGLFNRLLQHNPDNIDALTNMGYCLYMTGRLELALKTYHLALHLAPHDTVALRGIANCLENQGNFEEASAVYDELLSSDPTNAQWIHNLALIGDYTPDSLLSVAMKTLLQSPKADEKSRLLMSFALAKIHEAAGDHATAFGYYQEGNRLGFASAPYNETNFFGYLDLIESAFTSELFETLRDVGNSQASPIFVLGMPRSGTSLVEQILASHPSVHGAGELGVMPDIMTTLLRQLTGSLNPHAVHHLNPEAFASLAHHYLNVSRSHSSKPYIIDKMPNNIFYIGMIRLLFPNAKIIHCVRDPMDTCWSLYRQCFQDAHYYSYDQQSLGRFYVRYQQLMQHWKRVLGDDAIYDISYEQLVTKPESMMASLLDYCGLPWDDACLSFHTTKRAVATASMRQVRRPIYHSSLQSWKPVAHELAPLREILGY